MRFIFVSLAIFGLSSTATEQPKDFLLEYHMCGASHLWVTPSGKLYQEEGYTPHPDISGAEESQLSRTIMEDLHEWIGLSEVGPIKDAPGPSSKGCKGLLYVWPRLGGAPLIIRQLRHGDTHYNDSEAATEIVRFVNSYVRYRVSEKGCEPIVP
jgi:hypothetical protein